MNPLNKKNIYLWNPHLTTGFVQRILFSNEGKPSGFLEWTLNLGMKDECPTYLPVQFRLELLCMHIELYIYVHIFIYSSHLNPTDVPPNIFLPDTSNAWKEVLRGLGKVQGLWLCMSLFQHPQGPLASGGRVEMTKFWRLVSDPQYEKIACEKIELFQHKKA